MEGLDLALREADQRVAVPQRVVDEREGVLFRQRGEPERDLGEVDGHGVAVDAVEATLGDEAARGDNLVFAGRQLGRGLVGAPRLDEGVAELAAGFDEEGAGAHGGVADLQVEDRLGRGGSPPGPRRRARIGSSVVRTIGSVSSRGV